MFKLIVFITLVSLLIIVFIKLMKTQHKHNLTPKYPSQEEKDREDEEKYGC